MEAYIVPIVAALFLAIMACGLSYKLTSMDGPSATGFKSYFACLCVTYTLAVAVAEVFGAPVEAGEQVHEWSNRVAQHDIPAWSWRQKNDFARKILYVSIVPALIGVYCARRWPHKEQ